MKKYLMVFVCMSMLAGGGASALAGEDQQLSLILKELKSITKELTEIKLLIKKPLDQAQRTRATEIVVSIDDDPMIGSKDAQITIVEFTDYQCPYCGRFFKQTFHRLKKNFIDTKKVRYVLRDLPLPMHQEAKKAAEAANCANEQGQYWEMHALLFTNQKRLKEKNLKQYATELGLDTISFNECLASGRYSKEVEQDLEDSRGLGITGTPTFIIGRTQKGKKFKGKILRGAVPYAQFESVIMSLLE